MVDAHSIARARWSRWARTKATASCEQTSRRAPHGIPTRNGRAAFTDHTPTYPILHLIPHRMITAFLAGTRRWRGVRRPRGRARSGARIVGFELVFPLIYASTCLSSYPACSSEPRRVASMIRIDPAPAPYLTVLTFLSLTETTHLPFRTLSSNSAASGGRGGRPRAPRAARPSRA